MSNDTPNRRKNVRKGFDHEAIKWVRDMVRGLNVYERLVINNLASRCNPQHECYPEQRTIASECEISRSTVIRALKSLAAKNLISAKRRKSESCIYVLNVPESVPVKTSRKSESVPVDTLESSYVDTLESSSQNDHKKPNEVTKLSNQEEVTVEYSGDLSIDKTLGKNDNYRKLKEISTKKSFTKFSITESEDIQRRSAALQICARYYKQVPTQKVMVGFWWALMRHYFPDYPTKKLTRHQFRALKSVFDAFGDSAFYIVAAAIADWEFASVHAAQTEGLKPKRGGHPSYGDIPKLGPTPTFLSRAATGFADYWHTNWKAAKAA